MLVTLLFFLRYLDFYNFMKQMESLKICTKIWNLKKNVMVKLSSLQYQSITNI